MSMTFYVTKLKQKTLWKKKAFHLWKKKRTEKLWRSSAKKFIQKWWKTDKKKVLTKPLIRPRSIKRQFCPENPTRTTKPLIRDSKSSKDDQTDEWWKLAKKLIQKWRKKYNKKCTWPNRWFAPTSSKDDQPVDSASILGKKGGPTKSSEKDDKTANLDSDRRPNRRFALKIL